MTHLGKLFTDGPNASAGATRLRALILGTGVGPPPAGSAVELDTLALVGRLAYCAYRDYQQGRPTWGTGTAQASMLLSPPGGSGFELGAVTHATAILLIRAMIAGADAAGPIGSVERQDLLKRLRHAGLEGGARLFLGCEFDKPASVAELARAVRSPAEGAQVFTAARIAMDPVRSDGRAFLVALAARLGISNRLAAHINAAARSTGR